MTIPTTVTTIGIHAFSENQLTNVTIPKYVTTTGEDSFRDNPIEEKEIPNSITKITRISSPDILNPSKEQIEYYCFNRVFGFNEATGTITDYFGKSKDVEIPSTILNIPVTKIGDKAFFRKELTGVTIPNSVTNIGNQAFAVNKLTGITILDSVTDIGNYAFSSNQLTGITIPDSVTSIGAGAFNSNKLTSVEIPHSVTIINNNTFSNNILTSLEIPNSVTSVGNYAFASNQLTDVTILDSVTEIGKWAFSYNKLSNIEIPDSVTTIGEYAFSWNQLTGVEIPDSVTTIGERAFSINRLTSVVIPDSITSIENGTFSSNQLTEIEIPDSVTNIGAGAFSWNELTGVRIPNSVTTLGDYAFGGNQLTGVEIPDSITALADGVFEENLLTGITIPDSITSIGKDAFKSNKLTQITIPDSVEEIGAGAFIDNLITGAGISNNIKRILIPFSEIDPQPSIDNPTIAQIFEHCFDSGVSLLRYIKAGSNIRSTPGGTIIETLKLPIHVTGTVQGNYLKFTYKNQTTYAHLGVTSNSPPPITGYTTCTVNVRNAPNGDVIGSLSIGSKVSGTLEVNWVKFNYSGNTGYIYASLLQADPVEVTRYVLAGSNLRNKPGGTIIETLKMPIYVTGIIEGDYLKFTYKNQTAYAHRSVVTTSSPPITGYTKCTVNVRSAPNGNVIGSLSANQQVSGILSGNWVKFNYSGRTGYLYSVLLK